MLRYLSENGLVLSKVSFTKKTFVRINPPRIALGKSAADSETSLSIGDQFTININDSLRNAFPISES
jgi:hypothetical protein